MKNTIHSDTTAIGFQIAPMIDVVFVIMLFFMVMTGSVKVERELRTQLPCPGSSAKLEEFPPDEITIGIAEDGTVTMNEQEFDSPKDKALTNLTDSLIRARKSSKRQNQKVLVTIQAEEQASYELIIDVLNSLHKAEIQNVTFTVGSETTF